MRTTRARRRLAGALLAATAVLTGAGCDAVSPAFRVGMSYDRPGLGIRAWERWSGFDYVLAKDIARRLGHEGRHGVAFFNVMERRSAPATGDLPYDLLVAAYPPTAALRARGDLVGPYLRGGQDIAVRADTKGAVRADALGGSTVCLVTGTVFGDQAPTTFPGADITYRPTLSTCLTELRQGTVDAVSDEGLALRGYAAEKPFAGTIRVVGAPFPRTDYYLVVNKDVPGLCQQVKGALQDAVKDGTWASAYDSQLVRTRVTGRVPAPPSRITGCS